VWKAIAPSFQELVAEYENTAQHNDRLHQNLTALTWSEPILATHRSYVERNKLLGVGNAAFHGMWLRLLANRQFNPT
jgi:hypothetical protein